MLYFTNRIVHDIDETEAQNLLISGRRDYSYLVIQAEHVENCFTLLYYLRGKIEQIRVSTADIVGQVRAYHSFTLERPYFKLAFPVFGRRHAIRSRVFHEHLDEAEVEKLFENAVNGSYLIRESRNNHRNFTLITKTYNERSHLSIVENDRKNYCFANDPNKEWSNIDAIYEAIVKHQRINVHDNLKHPILSTKFCAADIEDQFKYLDMESRDLDRRSQDKRAVFYRIAYSPIPVQETLYTSNSSDVESYQVADLSDNKNFDFVSHIFQSRIKMIIEDSPDNVLFAHQKLNKNQQSIRNCTQYGLDQKIDLRLNRTIETSVHIFKVNSESPDHFDLPRKFKKICEFLDSKNNDFDFAKSHTILFIKSNNSQSQCLALLVAFIICKHIHYYGLNSTISVADLSRFCLGKCPRLKFKKEIYAKIYNIIKFYVRTFPKPVMNNISLRHERKNSTIDTFEIELDPCANMMSIFQNFRQFESDEIETVLFKLIPKSDIFERAIKTAPMYQQRVYQETSNHPVETTSNSNDQFDKIRKIFIEELNTMKNSDNYISKILIHGRKSSGKTYIIKSLVDEFSNQLTFTHFNDSDNLQTIKKYFSNQEMSIKPGKHRLVFIEDVERCSNLFQTELSKLTRHGQFIIGETNSLETMEDKFKSQFNKQILIDFPNVGERLNIIERMTNANRNFQSISKEQWQSYAKKLPANMNGEQVENLIKHVEFLALKNATCFYLDPIQKIYIQCDSNHPKCIRKNWFKLEYQFQLQIQMNDLNMALEAFEN